MSLKNETLLLESKLNQLNREKNTKEIECDMFITHIREEASPYLKLEELDIPRLDVAVCNLKKVVEEHTSINIEIKRLEKLL